MDSFVAVLEALSSLRRRDLLTLADEAGVPFHTLYKIQRGETKNPRIETIEAISKALRDRRVQAAA